VFVDDTANEVCAADRYSNCRVIVLDADTGAFKRLWGAFGNTLEDAAAAGRRRRCRGAAARLVRAVKVSQRIVEIALDSDLKQILIMNGSKRTRSAHLHSAARRA
jgi:hypothetical protein